jgi:hypothetical protein
MVHGQLSVLTPIHREGTIYTLGRSGKEFEVNKEIIRICNSKKDRKDNGQNNKKDKQNITHKTKDQGKRTPLKTGSELWCSEG